MTESVKTKFIYPIDLMGSLEQLLYLVDEVAAPDAFANGNVANGVDEGNAMASKLIEDCREIYFKYASKERIANSPIRKR